MIQNMHILRKMVLKTQMMTSTLKIFAIVDLIVILFCLVMGETLWLLNSQIALISSLLVTFGSYVGYKKNIESRAKEHITDDDDYDEVDKMDDTYDLYSPEVETKTIDEPTKEEITEAMQPIKQSYFANFKCAFSAMASFYRIFGYIILIIGFFFLNNNGNLHVFSYISGFIIVPISTLITSLVIKEEKEED